MPLSLEKVAKTAKHHSFVYDYSQRKSHCMSWTLLCKPGKFDNLTCRWGPGRPARRRRMFPCRSESGGGAATPFLVAISSLPASWLPRIERPARSSFSQVAPDARYGVPPGPQPHGRHSAPTRQLVGPLSRSDAPRVDLASSAFRQTGRHFSPFLTRWHTLSCRRRHIDTHHHASQVSNETDASAPAHWLSRALTCITFCIARSAHIDMHRSLHACSVHITVSNGVQPYTYAPVFMDSPIRYWSLLLLCGVSSAACVAGFFFGMQLARPHSASGQKFLRGFCPNPHSCCVHTD